LVIKPTKYDLKLHKIVQLAVKPTKYDFKAHKTIQLAIKPSKYSFQQWNPKKTFKTVSQSKNLKFKVYNNISYTQNY
jgi:hypothetical protein